MQGHKRASGLYSHEQLEKQTKNKTKTEVEEGRGFEFQLQQSDIQSKWKEAQRNVTGMKLKKKQAKITIRMCEKARNFEYIHQRSGLNRWSAPLLSRIP